MSHDFDRQVAEIRIRIAVLNLYTAFDIPVADDRRMSPSEEMGSTPFKRFVQQNPPDPKDTKEPVSKLELFTAPIVDRKRWLSSKR